MSAVTTATVRPKGRAGVAYSPDRVTGTDTRRRVLGLRSSSSRFWNERIETMPRERLAALQLQRLRALVDYAYHYSPFYRERFDRIGLRPEHIRTLDDFKQKVPITDKNDFLALQPTAPPYGPTLAIPQEFVAQHGETSGTTGVPLAIPFSMYDTIRYGESWVYGYWAIGIRPSDSFYFAYSWGLFMGFWSAYWGVRRLGCRVISGGGRDTRGHVETILRLKPTVVICTPSYALRIASVAAEMGVDLRNSSVRFTYHAGEPGPTALPALRKQIEEAWGAVAGENYGIAEIDALGMSCTEGDGVHINEMNTFTWAMDPATGKEVAEGEVGENIVTSVANTSQVLLNYRSHDLVRLRLSCPCGRTWAKLDGTVLGRTDHMVTLRGTNVYPTAVQNVLAATPGVSSFYELVLTRGQGGDVMTVRFEPVAEVPEAERDALGHALGERIRSALGVRLEVEPLAPGALPRYDAKSRRVVDRRPNEVRRELERRGPGET